MSNDVAELTRDWRIVVTERGEWLRFSRFYEGWEDEGDGVTSGWLDLALTYLPGNGWREFYPDYEDDEWSDSIANVREVVPPEFLHWVATQEDASAPTQP